MTTERGSDREIGVSRSGKELLEAWRLDISPIQIRIQPVRRHGLQHVSVVLDRLLDEVTK